MLIQIEKNIKTIDKDKEINTLYIVLFTELYAPFTVSRYSIYGEEILKEVHSYDNDFLKIGNKESLNAYYYTLTEEDGQVSSNYTIWKNGVKIYENLEEKYQIKGEEDIPIYGENIGINSGMNDGRITIPTHPFENRSIEEKEVSIVRPDDRHIRYYEQNIIPFSTDALSFEYSIPDTQVFPGYNEAQEIKQEEYNELKTLPEDVFENDNNVYKIEETGDFFHLSSNGERVIETPLPAYKNKPAITMVGSNSNRNDHYNKAYALAGRRGGDGLGMPVYNIISYPTRLYDSWLSMFKGIYGTSFSSANNNLTLRKSMRGYFSLGRYLKNSNTDYPDWYNLWDGGLFEQVQATSTFLNAPNTGYITNYTENDYYRFEIGNMPSFYKSVSNIANVF